MKSFLIKQSLFGFIAMLFVLMAMSPAENNADVPINAALVSNYRGVYVFYDTQPMRNYKRLGEIKKVISWSGVYSETRDALVRKAKDNWPNCNGIIIYPSNGLNSDVAEAIFIE